MNNIMKIYKHKIDIRLARFFDLRLKKLRGLSPAAIETFEALREFNLRAGKRIRPMLTVFSYKGFGGNNESEILKAALAVELMESFLLIHDDIMDEDELRRGYLTIHKVYEDKGKKLKHSDPKHYGNSIAIILGDIAAILGSEAILHTRFPIERKLAAVDKFNKVVINTCFGQVLDINSELEPITEKDVSEIHTLKTAIYTIEGPLQIGAILAGADKKQLKLLSRFAIPLGKAFQIQDDILGMFGNKKKIGKPIGSDIREGKKTLLIIKAMELAKKEEKSHILKCLGNKNITMDDINKLRKIVEESGSLDYSRMLMRKNIILAKKVLFKMDMTKEGKNFLKGVADYIISRDK